MVTSAAAVPTQAIKSNKQKADDATEIIGRVGCSLILGWILFKTGIVVVVPEKRVFEEPE